MKKQNPFFILIITFFLIFSHNVYSREKIKLAVLDFEGKNITQESTDAVTDLLRTELFNTGAFNVVERRQITQLLEEQQFQSSGLTNTDQAVEIGRLLNVEKIMIGTVTRLGNTHIINTRIVDVQTGLVELAEAIESRGSEENLPRAITELAITISYKVGLEGAVIRIQEDDIYIDLGQGDGIEIGQIFDVIRSGEIITDLEGHIIGTTQEVIGYLIITKIQDRFSIATVAQGNKSMQIGDLVKPSLQKIEELPVQEEEIEEPKNEEEQELLEKPSSDKQTTDIPPMF